MQDNANRMQSSSLEIAEVKLILCKGNKTCILRNNGFP